MKVQRHERLACALETALESQVVAARPRIKQCRRPLRLRRDSTVRNQLQEQEINAHACCVTHSRIPPVARNCDAESLDPQDSDCTLKPSTRLYMHVSDFLSLLLRCCRGQSAFPSTNSCSQASFASLLPVHREHCPLPGICASLAPNATPRWQADSACSGPASKAVIKSTVLVSAGQQQQRSCHRAD